MSRRLFLVAGYDAKNCIDDTLIYMLGKLSACGDIILVVDSDCSPRDIERARPYTIYATATRHGEYDFGSYKRAYIYAADNNLLNKYDFVYLVNDSVYGPTYDICRVLERMESGAWDAFGIVKKRHKHHPHIQSWFIGCRKSVFLSTWFDDFMRRITHQNNKGAITSLYENGFTHELINRNISWGALWTVRRHNVYNKIEKLYKSGMPFIKKSAITRHHGALGRQILYLLRHITPTLRMAILKNGIRLYGKKYMYWLLTKNRITIAIRNIHHSMYKLFIEGI